MSAMSANVESECEQHPQEELRFYCQDCEILICDDCITGGHKNHKNLKIKDYGSKIKEELKGMPDTFAETRLHEIEGYVEKAQEEKDCFAKSVKDGVEEIRSKKQEIIQKIDNLEKELIENLEASETDAMKTYDIFIKRQKEKAEKLKRSINEIQSKGTNISDDEAARYMISIRKLLEKDPFNDSIPSPSKYRYIFNSEFSKKEKLQEIIGMLESDAYANVEDLYSSVRVRVPPIVPARQSEPFNTDVDEIPPVVPSRPKTVELPPCEKYGYQETTERTPRNYEVLNTAFCTLATFRTEIPISHIVPKSSTDRHAYLLGTHIIDANCSEDENNTQKSLLSVSDVVTACLAKNEKLLIGLKNWSCLMKLEVKFNKHTLVRSFRVCSGKEKLACITRSLVCTTDHVACVKTDDQYKLRKFSKGKTINQDKILQDIENPVAIAENSTLNVCLLCRPEGKNSYVILLGEDGNTKMKFPSEDKQRQQIYVGIGFMEENTIFIIEETNPSVKLISFEGNCVADFPLDNKPVCCCVDESFNIWVSFDNNEMKIYKCNSENVYEVPT